MPLTRRRRSMLTLALLIPLAVAAHASRHAAAADAPAKPAPATAESGFTPIFNGHDLTGWVYGSNKGQPSKAGEGYRVRDGAIYSTAHDGGNLYTEKEYADFR